MRVYGCTVHAVPTVQPDGVARVVYENPHKMAPWVISYLRYIFYFSTKPHGIVVEI